MIEEKEEKIEMVIEVETNMEIVVGEKKEKIPQAIEVLTKEQEERIVELDIFFELYNVKVNKKRKKALVLLSNNSYETYKLGIVIASCCKVI